MIKINLAVKKKVEVASPFMGMSLKDLNLIPLAASLAIYLFAPDLITSQYQSKIDVLTGEMTKVQQAKKKIQEDSKGLEELKGKIQHATDLESKLNQRLAAVKQIGSTYKNPEKVLLYLAQNMPEDVWLNELTLNSEKFSIQGESVSYKSIGEFLDSLRESLYFNKDIKLDETKTKSVESESLRTEVFKISGNISRFE